MKKLVKRSKIITWQTKNLENLNIIDINSATIEHSKNSHKLSNAIMQAKKVSQIAADKKSNCPLYSETKKS